MAGSTESRICRVYGRLEARGSAAHIEAMVWDLGKAMRKKEEFESARLMDFEFRLRARTTRLLARELGLDEASLVREIAAHDEDGVIALIAGLTHRDPAAIGAGYQRLTAQARRELISERGDPTPYRLG